LQLVLVLVLALTFPKRKGTTPTKCFKIDIVLFTISTVVFKIDVFSC
jgi:hypothetical protein